MDNLANCSEELEEKSIKLVLNQPLDYISNYPPVWEILQTNNISTGVFLISSPHQKEYKSKYISFHLPDTFAPDSNASA